MFVCVIPFLKVVVRKLTFGSLTKDSTRFETSLENLSNETALQDVRVCCTVWKKLSIVHAWGVRHGAY